MHQYLRIMENCVHGRTQFNARTNTKCNVALNQRFVFSCSGDKAPVVTTRKINWKAAINEMLCYIRGYTELEQFHSLGVHTWDQNAKYWRPDEDTVGVIYGASAEAVGVGYLEILDQIKNNPTDRGIIWNFWNPEYFDQGCLRPCMFNHQFNVIDDTLYLTSTQRSADVPLGLAFNLIQCWFLLRVTAHLTGLKPGSFTLNISNAHVYENQLELAKIQLEREVQGSPEIKGIANLSLQDIMQGSVADKLEIVDYKHQGVLKYPFTV